MTRICMFTASLLGGGGRRAMLNLSSEFVRRGIPVDLVVGRKVGGFVDLVHPDVRVYDLGVARMSRALPGMVRYLRTERPSVLLSDTGDVNLIALWARRLSRVQTRVIIGARLMHTWEYQYYPSLKNRLTPRLFRLFYPWADAIVAVSQAAAQDLATISGIPRERVKVIYNPILTPALIEKAQEPLEHPWFVGGQPPVILAVGRLFKVKDFATLIHAFALVRQQRPTRLMILGEGEERPALEALAHQLGIQQDIALPGFVSNPYPYMNRATVFVQSSFSEALSNVLVEAMALGTSVVSTDCPGGTRETLEDGRIGRLVPVGDAQTMAAAICATLDKPPNVTVLQRRANDFSLEKSFAQYAEVLLGVQWQRQSEQRIEQAP